MVVTFPFIYITYIPINNSSKKIIIPKNLSTEKICLILEDEKVVPSAKLLELIIKVSGKERLIKYGYYVFPAKISYYNVYKILITGKERLIKFTIPEGYNIYQIADLLEKKGLVKKQDFIKFCFNKKMIENFYNNGISMEGYLFPDTYIIPMSYTIKKIVKTMNDNFKKKIINRLYYDFVKSKMGVNEIITLASIIQKETYYKKEMPIIASVFLNRLKKGMRLQSDPTVIYGIWNRFKGNLTRKDIETYTPYNTYKINGLPPTPICNPGFYAVYSVLHPAKTDYYYFVSTNRGYHVFSKTYKQHLRYIKIYQK